jgi:hypothetical protein
MNNPESFHVFIEKDHYGIKELIFSVGTENSRHVTRFAVEDLPAIIDVLLEISTNQDSEFRIDLPGGPVNRDKRNKIMDDEWNQK